MDVEEEVSQEGRKPKSLRDLGLPSKEEGDIHNMTHLPFRSWCPSCVTGRARDRPHRKGGGQGEQRIPEIVFDYAFLGAEGRQDTVAVLVIRVRRTQMLFAMWF